VNASSAASAPAREAGIGNPSAPHSLGAEARASLETARVKVARLCGGVASGVTFTSGATEANNLAIKGVALAASREASAARILLSPLEHGSVLNACRDLERRGATVVFLPVDGDGRIQPGALRAALRTEATLVSIGAASDEIGTLQPLAEIGRITRSAGVPLHVDAVGAFGRVPLGVEALGIDLLTVSSNDVYGPPGAGALWVRPEVRVRPEILGEGQESGYRSGTENVPALVGFGVAADLARAEAAHGEPARLAGLRDRLTRGLLETVGDCRLTGARESRLPHHLSLVLRGVKADSILLDLDLAGIAASSGSACASLTQTGSPALRAIGCSPDEMEGSLRFTLGRWSAESDVDAVLERLPAIVSRLRSLTPLGRR
jgi:cysteine desulfurase